MQASASKKALGFKILLGVVLLCLGILVGWLISNNEKKSIQIVPIRDPDSGYSLINPLLYTETSESLSYPTYTPLQNALTSYTNSVEESAKVSNIAIYFQDLNSSNWVGVNPAEKFDPASMLKVAVLMALLRSSEDSPSMLSQNITVTSAENIPDTSEEAYFPAADPIKTGSTYSVQDLMERLIVQSDDGADEVLVNFIGNSALSTIFTDLDIPLPGTSTGVSPQQYSHLFRTLYNATYLTSDDSEKALELLDETTYTEGLVAGVPQGTIVAHKFGESLFPPISDNATWPQTSATSADVPGLSDCGIIYYPEHPYFLCIMTQGTDFPTLAGVIKGASQLTWTQVSALESKK